MCGIIYIMDISTLAKRAREIWTERGCENKVMTKSDAHSLAFEAVEEKEHLISSDQEPYIISNVAKLVFSRYEKEEATPEFIKELFS